jgi:hypothetical protein
VIEWGFVTNQPGQTPPSSNCDTTVRNHFSPWHHEPIVIDHTVVNGSFSPRPPPQSRKLTGHEVRGRPQPVKIWMSEKLAGRKPATGMLLPVKRHKRRLATATIISARRWARTSDATARAPLKFINTTRRLNHHR